MFPGYKNGVSTEDIEDGFFRVRVLSLLELAAGTVCFICSIVALVYAWSNVEAVPLAVAVGVWTSLIVVSSALCGLGSTCMLISLYNKHIKNLLIAQWVLACISLPCICLYLGISAWVYVACSGNGNFPDWCYPNNHENVNVAIANMFFGSVMIVLTMPVIILFCFIMKLYKDLPEDVEEY